ncbi:hypothetical protein IAR55_001130 [Kwoniella newhampshirensis]|uniref:Nucleolar protein 9 n=1 Tax=Kwoniella newhampshirensis TaxID=1651941 RepID=A0AAW0Z4Y0_9TREE
MPKEQIRKRGRRKPKADPIDEAHSSTNAKQESFVEAEAHTIEVNRAGPSVVAPTGIHPARAALLAGRPVPVSEAGPASGEDHEEGLEEGQADWTRGPRTESDFPFGVLDPDVKAYFRSVEEQVKDWEGVSSAGEEREDRQLFLSSVLSELRTHELPTATDPETSIILERLLPSLNDWGRRVIGDSFGDKWKEVIRHRFGSHVVQSWMTLAADTLDREARDIWPTQQAKQNESVGKLPTMTELFITIIDTVLPSLPQLLSSPHSSPPIRLLLLLLTPHRSLPTLGGESTERGNLIRSKRSGKYRNNQGVKWKSIFGEGDENESKGKGKGKVIRREVPEQLAGLRSKIRKELMEKLAEGEWKAMGVDAVGSATVQLLLEFEVEEGEAENEGSLFDILTEGMISQLKKSPSTPLETQPYLLSLLASQTGTRLFEALLLLSPPHIISTIWSTYFEKKLGKLAGHPYANFVVAKGVTRLDKEQIEGLVSEIKTVSGGRGLIKAGRTSVIQALVDRSVKLVESQKTVLELLYSCLELPVAQKSALVPCLMYLKTYPMYQAILTGAPEEEKEDTNDVPPEAVDKAAEDAAAAAVRLAAWQNRRSAKPKNDGELVPNMQGCLILQGMMGMTAVTSTVLDSLTAQPVDTYLEYAKNPVASHFLDSIFTNPSVPPKYRRKVMMTFMGKYRDLVEDRMGSRVVDTIWEKADGFMKEKIARSLIPHLTELGGSQYGKYFIRRAEVGLLDRRPEEWRERIFGVKHHFAHQKENAAPASVQHFAAAVEGEGEGKKRKDKDEIDQLFEGVEKKKKKKV